MDAVETYRRHADPRRELDCLLDQERIVFCSGSRLLATLWVRSERGRVGVAGSQMPERLCGSCTCLSEALELCVTHQPSLLIATQILEDGSGIDLIRSARQHCKDLKTILFLQQENRVLFEQAVAVHPDGLLLESQIGSGHVIMALKVVSSGAMYLEPVIATCLHATENTTTDQLTERELQVMQRVVYGLTDRVIAQDLHLATETVKHYLKQVYQKLGVQNRTRAAIAMLLMGLVQPPRPLIP